MSDRAIVSVFCLLAVALVAIAAARPVPGAPVGVLGNPLSAESAALAVLQAGAAIVDTARDGTVAVASGPPGIVRRLYAAGAWLVLDATFVSACVALVTPSSPDRT